MHKKPGTKVTIANMLPWVPHSPPRVSASLPRTVGVRCALCKNPLALHPDVKIPRFARCGRVVRCGGWKGLAIHCSRELRSTLQVCLLQRTMVEGGSRSSAPVANDNNNGNSYRPIHQALPEVSSDLVCRAYGIICHVRLSLDLFIEYARQLTLRFTGLQRPPLLA
jgi:hypothetical protein